MNSTIIAALISGLCGIISTQVGNSISKRKDEAKRDEMIGLFNYKLEELTKKVEKHNNLIERMYAVEESAKLTEERIKVINHRLEDIEKGN